MTLFIGCTEKTIKFMGGWWRLVAVVLCGRATPSPSKRDDVTSPLFSDNHPLRDDDDRDRQHQDRFHSLFTNHLQLLLIYSSPSCLMLFITIISDVGHHLQMKVKVIMEVVEQ
ncbi:hypothetical protein Hanom_Chr09g00800371 [Helianthus anomalus]